MTDKELLIWRQRLYSWIASFEKAIVGRHFGHAKNLIDEACYYEVEDFTKRLVDHKILPGENQDMRFGTVEDCVNHHINNLKIAETWKEQDPPIVEEHEHNPDVLVIRIPNCTYLEPCKAGLDAHAYNGENFPCQRMGTFSGAARKYLHDNAIPKEKRKDITYFMESVHKEDGCVGILFVHSGLLGPVLKAHHLNKDVHL